jgi:CheY-like chemotaxis protein
MNPNSINILIADDDKDDFKLITEALQDVLPSCNCIQTKDGVAALRFIQSNILPDLVFLDLNMPLKNGISCLKDIQDLKLLPNTPIVIYSPSKEIDDIDESYKYGAKFYIVKPTSFSELKRIIKRAIFILGKPLAESADKSNFVLTESRVSYGPQNNRTNYPFYTFT